MTVEGSLMKYYYHVLSLVIIFCLILPLDVNALDGTLDFFPEESIPYGLTLEDWASKWWQWVYGQPKGSNPVVDDYQGNMCKNGQDNENVWYLAGSFINNSNVIRSCTVPLGKAILFPVSVAECSVSKSNWWNSLFSNITEKLWKTCDAKMVKMNSIVDGQIVNPLYVKSSKMFELAFPQNNVKNVEPGVKQAVSKGYWLMIGPLPLGMHNITSYAVDSHNFRSNITYYLTVK
jgi:hypothetical protein